jgi:hypothetical protein
VAVRAACGRGRSPRMPLPGLAILFCTGEEGSSG